MKLKETPKKKQDGLADKILEHEYKVERWCVDTLDMYNEHRAERSLTALGFADATNMAGYEKCKHLNDAHVAFHHSIDGTGSNQFAQWKANQNA